MSNLESTTSLRHFLEHRQLASRHINPMLSLARYRFEDSPLLCLVDRTWEAFNSEAGRALIEGLAYLPPEPAVRSFTFEKGFDEYVMRLEVWGRHPTLLFLLRRWRDASPNPLVRWFHRAAGTGPLSVVIKYRGLIYDELVSDEEVKRWFFYLLSGLHRSHRPSLKSPRVIKDREG
jgi:hypothetical protein